MENYNKYAEYTKRGDWAAICGLNGVVLDSFGTRKELKILGDHLEPDEVVFALTSGIMSKMESSNSSDMGSNTWLVVLTSDRFLFLDCALLSSSVDSQSIRHDRVQAVSASQGWVLGKIMVDIGSRTVIIDNCQKATVTVIASLANKWLKEREAKPTVVEAAGGVATDSSLDRLERLASLFASGALSQEEFSAAKARLLAQI